MIKKYLLDLIFPGFCISCNTEGSFLCEKCAHTLHPLPPSCFLCGMMTPTQIKYSQDNTPRPLEILLKDPLHLKENLLPAGMIPGMIPAGITCARCRKNTCIRVFISPFSYHHPLVRQLIHEFKYRRIRSLSPLLSHFIISYIHYYGISFPRQACIVPIPLHPRRQRVRGFNQASLLAENISERLSIPVDARSITRIAATAPQVMLTAQHRRTNVENIFSLRDQKIIQGNTIILVDDVKTTGATLEQAARMLKRAGAKEIWAITFAH